jgi:adenylate kinase family enzyme
VPRPAEDFHALHDAAIADDRWVMDGNYSACMPQRFQRATGLILLDVSTLRSLWRYLRRTCFEQDRLGGLEGGRDSLKWTMIHHIAVVSPRNRKRYVEMVERVAMPKVSLPSARAIRQGYRQWDLP